MNRDELLKDYIIYLESIVNKAQVCSRYKELNKRNIKIIEDDLKFIFVKSLGVDDCFNGFYTEFIKYFSRYKEKIDSIIKES